jgi:hypothetical protein
MTPTGLQHQPKTSGKSHNSDLVVPPVVPLAAKVDCSADEIAILNDFRLLTAHHKQIVLDAGLADLAAKHSHNFNTSDSQEDGGL